MTRRERALDQLAFYAERLLTEVMAVQIAAGDDIDLDRLKAADDRWMKSSCDFAAALERVRIEAATEVIHGPQPALEIVRLDGTTPTLRPVQPVVAEAVVDAWEAVRDALDTTDAYWPEPAHPGETLARICGNAGRDS